MAYVVYNNSKTERITNERVKNNCNIYKNKNNKKLFKKNNYIYNI